MLQRNVRSAERPKKVKEDEDEDNKRRVIRKMNRNLQDDDGGKRNKGIKTWYVITNMTTKECGKGFRGLLCC